jgi:hypothetical protein
LILSIVEDWTLARQDAKIVQAQFNVSDSDLVGTIFLDGLPVLEDALQDGLTRLADIRWGGSAVHHVEAHEHAAGSTVISCTASPDISPLVGWPRVDDAYVYRIYAGGIRRGLIIQDETLAWYEWALTGTPLSAGWHKLEVTATDSSGNESVKRTIWHFVFTPLPAPSGLAISGPIGGPYTLTITP